MGGSVGHGISHPHTLTPCFREKWQLSRDRRRGLRPTPACVRWVGEVTRGRELLSTRAPAGRLVPDSALTAVSGHKRYPGTNARSEVGGWRVSLSLYFCHSTLCTISRTHTHTRARATLLAGMLPVTECAHPWRPHARSHSRAHTLTLDCPRSQSDTSASSRPASQRRAWPQAALSLTHARTHARMHAHTGPPTMPLMHTHTRPLSLSFSLSLSLSCAAVSLMQVVPRAAARPT